MLTLFTTVVLVMIAFLLWLTFTTIFNKIKNETVRWVYTGFVLFSIVVFTAYAIFLEVGV